jgi:uncharacterized protein YoxC
MAPMLGMAIQMDAASVDALERIATAQMVMAAIMVVIGLIAMGGAMLVLLELRSARRLLHNLADTVDDMKPRVAPLLDRANHIATDVEGMMDNVRRRVDDVLFTVEDLHRSVQRGQAAAEERVQRFAAVVDLVQTEAEDLLLDAAATARGVHVTARQLREEPARRPAGGRTARGSSTDREPAPRKPFDTPLEDDEIEEIFE